MKKRPIYEVESILNEMREEYWRGIEEVAEVAPAETRNYVVFRLGGERYGVPAAVAQEVLKIPRLVRVPRVGEHIRGVVNLRGQIVAVTDLRFLLGLSKQEIPVGGRLVVVQAADLLTALITEKVEGIKPVELESIEPLTEGLVDFPREIVAGQVTDESGLLILLDMEKILSRPEFVVDQKGAQE